MTLTREPVSTRLKLGILGPLVASLDDRSVNLGGQRQRSVIAVLLLARGQVVSTERLLDALWAGDPPASAAGGLQAYVSHLRRSLEPGRPARAPSTVLVSQSGGYALRVPDHAVDAWQFERIVHDASAEPDPLARAELLRSALAMWRGPALVEYGDQDWAAPDAHRLTELRSLAREQLLAARLDAGETAILVPEIQTLLDEEPLREERWRLLALAQYRSHRQADALATLRRARAMLAEELGVDPGPALRSLEAEVLAQSETLDVPPRPGLPPQRARQPVVLPQRVVPAHTEHDLVDRDAEVHQLTDALHEALAGRATLALVEGPAGIGKSRLLIDVRERAAAAGATVLTARGSQLEKEFGFGVVRQLFDPLLADPARRTAALTGAAQAAAGVFDGSGAEHQPPGGLFGVLHGLYWLTANVAADGPLVLAVDDVQWSDSGSLRYLAYLIRRLEGLPVLVVATLRTGEPYDAELLAELGNDELTVPVRPAPLSRDGVAALVRERLGPSADEPFVTACHRTTSGNPLLLRQLLRALEAERVRPDASHADTVRAIGSRAVSSLVMMRFSRMPPDNRAVARAVSVLGDRASLPTIASLTDLSEERVAAAVATLARAEVLRPDFPLGFVHPLVGDAVYEDIPVGERELQHDRAARVLGASGATPEQIAAHLMLVPRRGDRGVVRVLREAAARDIERGAAEGAVAYLRRALKEPPTEDDLPGLLLDLGRIETMSDGPAAVQHLREAYRAFGSPREKAEAAIVLVRTLVFAGTRGQATEVARLAVRDLPPGLDDHRQALVALEHTSAYMHGIRTDALLEGVDTELTGNGPGARALAAALAWKELCAGIDRDRALALARFAVGGDTLYDEDSMLLWVVGAMVLGMAGDDTRPLWSEALDRAHRRGSLFATLSAHLWGGYAQWCQGDLREALHSMLSCTEQNQMWGAPELGRSYADPFAVAILVDRGDLVGARTLCDQVRDLERMSETRRIFGQAEAMLLLAEGHPAEALVRLESVQHEMAVVENPVWRPWRSLRAVVLADLGRGEEALELVDEELVLARRWGTPELVGRTLRIRSELAGDVDGLREAAGVLSGSLARLEEARAWSALGSLLVTGADRAPAGEGLEALHRALELSERCGADGLRAEAAATLRRSGVAVPAEPSATTSLTATERRIAGLAVQGVTEREIAQSLFVTPRRVQETLAAVSARLGVRSLTDLRGLLEG